MQTILYRKLNSNYSPLVDCRHSLVAKTAEPQGRHPAHLQHFGLPIEHTTLRYKQQNLGNTTPVLTLLWLLPSKMVPGPACPYFFCPYPPHAPTLSQPRPHLQHLFLLVQVNVPEVLPQRQVLRGHGTGKGRGRRVAAAPCTSNSSTRLPGACTDTAAFHQTMILLSQQHTVPQTTCCLASVVHAPVLPEIARLQPQSRPRRQLLPLQ